MDNRSRRLVAALNEIEPARMGWGFARGWRFLIHDTTNQPGRAGFCRLGFGRSLAGADNDTGARSGAAVTGGVPQRQGGRTVEPGDRRKPTSLRIKPTDRPIGRRYCGKAAPFYSKGMPELCPRSLPPGLRYMKKSTSKKWTYEQWATIYGRRFEEKEILRKASLPPECHLAPDDDSSWTRWQKVEGGEFGSHWERETIISTTPLVDLILGE